MRRTKQSPLYYHSYFPQQLFLASTSDGRHPILHHGAGTPVSACPSHQCFVLVGFELLVLL